jgi:hypothetical protein
MATTTEPTGSGVVGNQTQKPPSVTPAAQQSEEPVFAVPGVSVGPLVSRGAAPLGPLLGTVPGDPIPALDRNERAFDLSWSGSETGLAGNSEILSGHTSRLDTTSSEGTPAWQRERAFQHGEAFVSLIGPGGLPALGTSVRGDQTEGDPEAILATLASLTVPEGSREVIAGAFVQSTSEVSKLDQRAHTSLIHGDFVAAACGLALGLSLTAGPLYPDLLTLVRSWAPRRGRRPSQPSVEPTPRSAKRRPRTWLGRVTSTCKRLFDHR